MWHLCSDHNIPETNIMNEYCVGAAVRFLRQNDVDDSTDKILEYNLRYEMKAPYLFIAFVVEYL